MSDYNNKTFLKEIQENYKLKIVDYIPVNFCESGLNIILERKVVNKVALNVVVKIQ